MNKIKIPEVLPEEYHHLYYKALEEKLWFKITAQPRLEEKLILLMSPKDLEKYSKFGIPDAKYELVNPRVFVKKERKDLKVKEKLIEYWEKKISDSEKSKEEGS